MREIKIIRIPMTNISQAEEDDKIIATFHNREEERRFIEQQQQERFNGPKIIIED